MTSDESHAIRYDAPSLLVVTDLDGTLLDHFSYSFDKAREAIGRLQQLHVPLVPNTSKTGAELRQLRKELGNNDPFICENGSAIFLPRDSFPMPPGGSAFSQDYYLVELGMGYQDILARLTPLKERFSFRGFNDMEANEIQQLTGLDEQQVSLAMRRRFSEPLVWEDSDAAREEFLAELAAADLHILQGGRFLHVLGNTDKGQALDRLRTVYKQLFGLPFTVIALGDSENDLAMLKAADWPVIVRSPSHELPDLQCDQPVTISDHIGPEGWNECVLALVDKLLSERGE
jgi:mannosyl-3-phosphoglycerate phosphatase